MSSIEKSKNVIEDSDISAKGDVNIGDRTTINVFGGLQASQKDLQFFIRVYILLIGFFAIASVLLLIFPPPEVFPKDYIGSFASGGFFALGSLILIFFIRSLRNSNLAKTISNEVQNNS